MQGTVNPSARSGLGSGLGLGAGKAVSILFRVVRGRGEVEVREARSDKASCIYTREEEGEVATSNEPELHGWEQCGSIDRLVLHTLAYPLH